MRNDFKCKSTKLRRQRIELNCASTEISGMLKWKICLLRSFAILIASSTAAISESSLVLEKLDGSANYVQSEVWHGRFTALNGQAFDVSEFYEPEYPNFHLEGILSYPIANRGDVIIPFLFDAGYKSALFVAGPLLSLGIGYTRNFGNFGFYFGSHHVLKIGGKISEKPCIDKFNREFHCGTGLAWVDAVGGGILKKSEIRDFIEFRIAYRF